jgi:phosphate transport system permease protein
MDGRPLCLSRFFDLMTESSTEIEPAASPESQPASAFTGRARQRKTKTAVLVADRFARGVISVSGIATIISVIGVLVFLVAVVVPLFLPGKAEKVQPLPYAAGDALQVGIDEYQRLGYLLHRSGKIDVFTIDGAASAESPAAGESPARSALLAQLEIAPAGQLTDISFEIENSQVALGLADGSIELARLGFEGETVEGAALPADIRAKADQGSTPWREGVVEKTGENQYRFQALKLEKGTKVALGSGKVLAVSHLTTPSGPQVAALAEKSGAGVVAYLVSFEEKSDFLTGATTLSNLAPVEIAIEPRPQPPVRIAIAASGVELLVAWQDGLLDRFDIRDPSRVERLERGYLVDPNGGSRLTALAPILGGSTFLWGDSAGRLRGGFPVRPQEAEDPASVPGLLQPLRHPEVDAIFAKTKELSASGGEVRALGASSRSRLAVAGRSNGRVELYHVTSGKRLLSLALPTEDAILAVALAPKEDGILAATAKNIFHAQVETGYPEAGFQAFIRPVWYEGYPEPAHVWQSSSGTDDFEMKLGLVPLIFGTIKATVYSMLLGAPLAILAAIFTSEFLRGRSKAILKPSIELMASLPSVVLGFLAALVIAPWVEGRVPAVLAGIFVLPIVLLLGAQLWQLLPTDQAIRWERFRFWVLCLLVPLGCLLSSFIGPLYEQVFFAGDFMGWLSWEPGKGLPAHANPIGGTMFLLVPISALLVMLGQDRWVAPLLRAKANFWDRRRFATADLGKVVAGIGVTFLLALALSALLAALGFDPRGCYFDTYVQRNALIVGFVMGFAVIPIIYTISEDALSAVPEHLRSASLGAGATPWQTAVRIVIPTATSGLFSALMIGLGRAVGETMIVLMAAGNTPVLSWNLFEGFRTLSANIAVELPEAVRGGIHYRSLFLAALVLFLLTFVVNTVAEVIRQRFRKRAFQL